VSAGQDGGAAFPGWKRLVRLTPDGVVKTVSEAPTPGMSYRDWLAGLAMAAIIGKTPPVLVESAKHLSVNSIDAMTARSAYEYADAMLAARTAAAPAREDGRAGE
jgi:hypothetical protein